MMSTPELSWTEAAPGVWRAQIGKKDSPTLLEAAGAEPALDRMSSPAKRALPFDLDAVRGGLAAGRAFASVPLGKTEKIFGFGLQFQGSVRRGRVFHLKVDHYDDGQDETHAPVPLYVSEEGYAVLFNSPRHLAVYPGLGNRLDEPSNPPIRDRNTDPKWQAQPFSGMVEASATAPGMEILIFEGPTPMEAIERYNLYSGGGTLPPKWSLGFWHRTPTNATAEAIEAETTEFEERGYPLDVIGLEPGWQSKAYPGTFDWSDRLYPDPSGFVKKMTEKGLHVNLWENPYFSPQSSIYEEMKPHFATHMVWMGAVPDLLHKGASEKVMAHHARTHLDIGVSGYKIDEVDGYDQWLWPDHAMFPSGIGGEQMRQIYGSVWQRELDGMFRSRNQRTLGLVRASNAGAAKLPFAIYSDHYDHGEFIAAQISTGLAGVLWCAEIRSASNSEEWVRRMQSACLSHIAQLNAWSSGTKPWSFPEVEDEVRTAMMQRISLFPYLYTSFAKYWRDGTPPIYPMALVDGGTETDQYMLGQDLLVAPIITGTKKRNVRLPKGLWYDYYSGDRFEGGSTIEVEPPLDQIPIYVRSGSVIPTIEPALHLKDALDDPLLILRRYGTGPAQADLYDDDGETFDYEKGEGAWIDLSVVGETVTQTVEAGAWESIYKRIKLLKVGAG